VATKFWTPAMLENPDRVSGYDHVSNAGSNSRRWRANCGSKTWKNGKYDVWIGPGRVTPKEAAQDYCNYMNGLGVSPATTAWTEPTIDMGNITEHQPKRQGSRGPKLVEGPRDLYDVLFYDPFTKEVVRRKVGITARGLSRYTGVCKMLGLSMKPNAEPVTLPSEKAARVAEDKLIAEICKDDKWQRAGKESFAPVGRKVTT
jgi:hypothetical protein